MTDRSADLSDNRIFGGIGGSDGDSAVLHDCVFAMPEKSEDESPRIFPAVSTVVALGDFDGVHIAHVRLLRIALELAKKHGVSSAVFTFLQSKGEYITNFDEKLRLIRENGVKLCCAADFDKLRDMSPEEFVRRVLVGKMSAVHVVCGYNFRFGRHASGDTSTLAALCARYGIGITVMEKITLPDGSDISSTQIRDALRAGEVERAARMLGRAFSLSGRISHGRAVGRQNARPTLNLVPGDGAVTPKNGVYFTRCTIDGRQYPSISNIGVRPTFESTYGESVLLCEVHLLGDLHGPDMGDGLYGREIKVEFDCFCRPEMKFVSPSELYERIERDVCAASKYYGI